MFLFQFSSKGWTGQVSFVGVQIVLQKGVILNKPVKKVTGQTELPNLQTHAIGSLMVCLHLP